MQGPTEEHTGKDIMADSPSEPEREHEAELNAVLDAGEIRELPPNKPKGILGETGFDLHKVDDLEPDLNAGISQENDLPVVWLAIIVAYFIFFPLAYWILWRSPLFSRAVKVRTSLVGAMGLIGATTWLLVR